MYLLKNLDRKSSSIPAWSECCAGQVSVSVLLGLLLFLSGLSIQVTAHHSAACCDFTQSVPIEGIVKSIDVMNPHVKLVLIVTGTDGSTREIYFEGHSRNNVYRRGWRPDMVKPGDKITINIAPVKTGEDGGYIHSFTLQDGRQF